MATTTFQTKFFIGAKYTGASEVAKANRGIDSVERNLKGLGSKMAGVHKSMIGMGTAVKGAAAAFVGLYAVQKVSQLLHSSIDAAFGVAKAHDQLGASLERNKARLNMTAKSVAIQKKRFIDLAEAQEKAGGFDAEIMERGWSKLLDTMSPGQIERFSQSYSDMIAKITDGQPTEENVIAITQAYNMALKSGRPALLRKLNATKQEMEVFKKLKTQEERRLFLEKYMLKFQGETARQSQTTSGKIRQMTDAIGNLFETFGKPFVDRASSFADSFRRLAVGLGPLAEKIAGGLAPAFENFSKWIAGHGKEIVGFFESMVTGAGKVWDAVKDLWGLLDQVPVVFDVKKHAPAIKGFFGMLKEQWATSVTDTKTQWNTLVGNIQSGFAAAQKGAGEFRTAIIAQMDQTNAELPEPLKKIYETITSWFKSAYDKVLEIWKPINQKLWEGFSAVPPGQAIPPTTGTGVGGTGGEPGDYKPPWQAPTPATPPPPETTATSPTTMSAAAAGSTAAALDAKLGGRLKGQGATIVAAAQRHHVDPYLLASIAQIESAKGTSYSIRTRNAPVGMMDPKNPHRHQSFASLEAGIEAGAALLERGYIKQGRTTPASIGAKWAPPGASNDPNRTNAMWPGLVTKERARLMEGAPKAEPITSLNTTTRSLNKRSASSGFSPISLTLSPQTTINGASAGQEQALMRQHERILQNTNHEFINKLAEIQSDLARTTYT